MMLELLRPWALVLLPLPFLAWRALPAIAANAALPVPAPIRGLMAGLSDQGRRRRRRPEDVWLKALGWILLLVALAGPYNRDSILLTPTGRDLIIAVDLSASMEQQDMVLGGASVPRYAAVREMLKDFIKARRGDRVGLIAYGHEAYLVAPLGYDVDAVTAVQFVQDCRGTGPTSAGPSATRRTWSRRWATTSTRSRQSWTNWKSACRGTGPTSAGPSASPSRRSSRNRAKAACWCCSLTAKTTRAS